jgi:hypothetical protein
VVDWVLPASADVVDGPVPVVCDPAPGSLFPIGSTTVSCSATDAAGNVTTVGFVVAVAAPPAPEPIPDDPVEEEEEEATPQEPVLEDTAAGGPTVEPPPVAVVAPAPPMPTVLPDTSLTAAGTAGVSIGFVLVAVAAVAAAARRRPGR